ncbi:hypothetical protein ACVIHH_000033 [Bradyrhizobium sp. USDA 4518]
MRRALASKGWDWGKISCSVTSVICSPASQLALISETISGRMSWTTSFVERGRGPCGNLPSKLTRSSRYACCSWPPITNGALVSQRTQLEIALTSRHGGHPFSRPKIERWRYESSGRDLSRWCACADPGSYRQSQGVGATSPAARRGGAGLPPQNSGPCSAHCGLIPLVVVHASHTKLVGASKQRLGLGQEISSLTNPFAPVLL